MASAASPRQPAPLARYTVGVLTFAYVLSFVDRFVLSLMIEPIKADLGLSDTQISLLAGLAFALFYAAMGLPLGRLADLWSRKLVIVLGIAFWSMATALSGLARGFSGLFVARIGVGIGEAALTPAAHSMFADMFPREQLARAIGVYTTGGVVGAGVALLLGGVLYEALAALGPQTWPLFGTLAPWQATFVVVGLPGLLVALVILLTVPEPARRSVSSSTPHRTLGEVARHLRGARSAYGGVFATFSLISVFAYSYVTWAPTYLVRSFGLSPGDAGLQFGLIMLLFGSTGPFCGGLLADRLFSRGITDGALRAMALAALALFVPAIVAFQLPSLPATLIAFAVCSLLFTATLTLGPAAVQMLAPDEARGQMSAISLLLSNVIGLGLGPLIVAFTSDTILGGPQNLGLAFSIVNGLALSAAVLIGLRSLPAFRAALPEVGACEEAC